MRRVALLIFVVLIWSAQVTRAAERPNIIFILVDDLGYYDLGCYGGDEFDTPRIDRMAREGIRLSDYYAAAPICSPSRAGILTGCYPRRVGLATWVQRADSNIGIHPDELTLAELFKAEGYATACVGKWHLGFKPPFLPRRQGFDHYFGLLHNLDHVETVYFEKQGGVPLIRNGKVPLRRPWRPAGEWQPIVTRDEYERAFFHHGSHGALAAVRLDQWKLTLHPTPALYDLEKDPGERKPVRNGAVIRKLRGMAVMFQEGMSRDARPAGCVDDT